MSLRTSLLAEGVKLDPWISGSQLDVYRWKTMDGLLDLRGGLQIIAINNAERGNGNFKKLLTLLETAAIGNGVPLLMCQIWNESLAKCLEKRGWRLRQSEDLGLHAIAPEPAPHKDAERPPAPPSPLPEPPT